LLSPYCPCTHKLFKSRNIYKPIYFETADYGDSAYDSRANFNKAASMGAEPVIKPRKYSSGKGILNTARGGRLRLYSYH